MLVILAGVGFYYLNKQSKPKENNASESILTKRISSAQSGSLAPKVQSTMTKQGIGVENLSSDKLSDCQYRVAAAYESKYFSVGPGEKVLVDYGLLINNSAKSTSDYNFNVDSAGPRLFVELVCKSGGVDQSSLVVFPKSDPKTPWTTQLPDSVTK